MRAVPCAPKSHIDRKRRFPRAAGHQGREANGFEGQHARHALQVDTRLGVEPDIPLETKEALYRIAQEALVNVERHAHARRVDVRWWCNGSAAALEVADDGSGFPEGKAGRLDSYGIIGMRERASSVGATLEIASAAGRGTVVRCVLAGE